VHAEFTVREPDSRIIRAGGEEILIRKLSPEERARRRLRNNIMMAVSGAIIMALAVWLLM